MDAIFSLLQYLVVGFFGLLGLLFVLALLFGKRMVKQWDLEAEFRDASGREFGELDVERSRVEKEEADFTTKATFKMRHEAFAPGATVQVFVEDVLLLEGPVEHAGRVWLRGDHLQTELTEARAGQRARVVVDGEELAAQPLKRD